MEQMASPVHHDHFSRRLRQGGRGTDTVFKDVLRKLLLCFHPFLLPTMAFVAMFLWSYYSFLPMRYKLALIGMVSGFTYFMPVGIYLTARYFFGFNLFATTRKDRFSLVLQTLVLLSYVLCWFFMWRVRLPNYMVNIVQVCLVSLLLILCSSSFYTWSSHLLGIGMVIGGLVSYGFIFGFSPLWWIALFILIGGLLGSAQLYLRLHTPLGLLWSFLLGILITIIVVYPGLMLIFMG